MEEKTQTLEELQAQINELQKKLKISEYKKTEAETRAHSMAQASPFLGSNTEEQPTGRTVSISVCVNPHERSTKKQKFKDIDYPTYFYSVQLPAGAGLSLSVNGQEYFHGQTYELNALELPAIKSMVSRTWDHEKSIHGENENAYRRQSNMRV